MMLKKFILVLLLSINSFSFSQEVIKTFTNHLKPNGGSIRNVIQVINQKNDDISFFLMDAKKIYGYLLNSNFEITQQLSSENRSRKYQILLGSSVSDNDDYRIYVTNNHRDKFASINFSYKKNSANLKEFKLTSKKEVFIQTVVYNNTFYIISILKNSSILNIYTFDDFANYKVHQLDFSKEKFIDRENSFVSLYNLLTISTGVYGLGKSIDIKKIEYNNPNSLEITSEFTKLYVNGTKLLFSFDISNNFTQTISIDLNTFEKQVKNTPSKKVALICP